MNKGKLFLIPTVIAENTETNVITEQVRNVIKSLDYFLVENIRTARRYISKLKLGVPIEELQFELLDKNTDTSTVEKLLSPVVRGRNVGIISESGCPGVADPGSIAVASAHQKGIQVIPITGPSSILMALMASGFNGQSFTFHGYLPIDKKDRIEKIRSMERDAQKLNQTQIFMDTPYRNQKLFQDVIKTCSNGTMLSVARGITGVNELILTKDISNWEKTKIDLNKIPTIFSIHA
ncbi:SAM-dependent methyltransferase [Reichenbachiella versicolor]|uniref:SAM-dependent methyltransferase n=1 Tax=Reichenbachiella versicolor TaxID=1821036 RepID=UPI000D6E03ED|nr:SAM-dependent methyltransferase [Reichenbachiella versicolor]